MTQIAAHASFTLDSLFVASARRAGKAAVLERETPAARGFASRLEAARSQYQPMSLTKREAPDRAEEDPERWDGLS